jgi:hypothetical protein
MEVFVVAQLALVFGLGGLFWPDKFIAVFDVLLFPWPASYRTVRMNSVAAIAFSMVLAARLLAA